MWLPSTTKLFQVKVTFNNQYRTMILVASIMAPDMIFQAPNLQGTLDLR